MLLKDITECNIPFNYKTSSIKHNLKSTHPILHKWLAMHDIFFVPGFSVSPNEKEIIDNISYT